MILKKHLLRFYSIIALVLGLTPSLYGQTYCTAINTDCNFEYVTNVNLSTINYTSDCGVDYDDYTSEVAYIAPGTSVSGTITKSDILTNYVAVVFIDWNQNGTFDATEQITTNLQGTSTFVFTVTPPLTALTGPTRMRVRMAQNTVPGPCTTENRGDTEDYTVMVTAATPPPPANDNCANAIVMTPSSFCSNTGGTTISATESFPAGTCGTGLTANDVWYSFTADGIAEYEINVTGNGAGTAVFDPILEVYSSCASTSYIDCINATTVNGTEVLNVGVLPAGTYYYRIYGSNGNGNFTTCVVDVTPQPGDDCDTPLDLPNLNNDCSIDQRYNNFGAVGSSYGPPACWTNTSRDVWFSFTAIASNVRIDVFGAGSGGNTLLNPQIAIYSGACAAAVITEGCATTTPGTNDCFLSIGGLTVGTTYLIRVDSGTGDEGTFKLCIDNFTPPVLPGQDCATARVICNKNSITETDITGFGNDGAEAAGSCLAGGVSPGSNTEQNSTWYTWTAADNGTFGFDIIPSAANPNLDIDFVVFQMDPVTGCTGRTMLRCMGSSCTGPTGLNATSVDITEPFDCDPAVQDNYVQELTMVAGVTYGLLVNNFQFGGSGYTINFNGTGNLLGPQPGFEIASNDPCVVPQTIVITDTSVNADTYLWNFGSGASPATANTAGPHTVTYATSGTKTITLTVTGAGGCDSILQKTYVVADPVNATASVIDATCDLDNGSITVNATGGNGAPADLMYQLDGGTVQSSNVFNNLFAGNYVVTVIDTANCSFDLNVTVNGTPQPVLDPIADVVTCDQYILPAITGTNLTGNESYYTAINGGGTQYNPGQAITTSTTLYAYDATTTVPACTAEESFSITINQAPQAINVQEMCNPGNTAYQVSFDIVGGDPATYMVSVEAPLGVNGTLTGSSYVTDPINSGTGYTIEITDGNGCPATVVSGIQNCNCTTDAGSMNSTTMNMCGSGPQTATHNAAGYINDGNDTLQFVLHDNSTASLGNQIQIGNTPTFSFDPATMTYGATYYISAIAGDDLGGGIVDQTDPCFSVTAGTPVVWNEQPTADISGDTAICNGESTDLTFTLTGVSPFSVTFNNGTSNQTASNLVDQGTFTLTPTVTRTYTIVSVNSANGCSGSFANTTVTIVVNNPPNVSQPTYICNSTGDAYQAVFDVTDGDNGPYTVTGISPMGVSGSFSGNTFTSTDIPSGTSFEFEIDDNNECGPVYITGTHNCACQSFAGLMDQSTLNVCDPDSAMAIHDQSAMVLDGDDTLNYVIHDQAGNSLGTVFQQGTSSQFGFTAGMTYGTIYYISAIVGDNDGTGMVDLTDNCLNVASGTPVIFNPTPTTTAGAVQNPICAGTDLELTASDYMGGNFSWTHSNSSYTSSQQNPIRNNASVNMSGDYTVTVQSNGCSSTSTVTITVNPVPNTSINANPADPFCTSDNDVTLTSSTAGGTWSGTGITDANAGTFSPSNAGPGTHTVTYSIQGDCPSSSTRDIVVNQTPVSTFTADLTEGCDPLEVSFTADGLAYDTYTWDLGNGTVNNDPETTSTTYTPGVYTISLTTDLLNCSSTTTLVDYISSYANPVAAFTYDMSSSGEVQFNNESENGANYFWDFGDDNTSTEFEPLHTYSSGGTYEVTFEVTSAEGCIATLIEEINVVKDLDIFIPNSFTPDGDEFNNLWKPVIGGDFDPTTYRLEIYNRWGELIFVSNDINTGWDGTFANQPCANGIYTYKVYMSNLTTDNKVERKGVINLMR
ncbi:MAG: PKD domain-containing protein [Crocinitomicaceae bacterium]|jgi:gliding motility-associated-like protein|nr:PKD domain-containing protein [Crocinitomicaceae bacterium]